MKILNTIICLIGTGITLAKLTPVVTFLAALLTCIIGLYTLFSIIRKEFEKYNSQDENVIDKAIDEVESVVNKNVPKNIFGSIGASGN